MILDRPNRRTLVVCALAAILALLALYARLKPDPERLRARAQAEYNAGRFVEAQSVLDQLTRFSSPSAADLMVRAQTARALGRTNDALRDWAAIRADDPLGPTARFLAGREQVARGRLRDAEALFLDIPDQSPLTPRALRELAYIYALQQRLDLLDAAFAKLSAAGELDDMSLLLWSRIHFGSWDTGSDLATLGKALEADPDDRWTRLALASGLRRAARLDDAAQLLIALPQSDPEARALRAALAFDRGNLDLAESLLADGSPNHPKLARLRGSIALVQHNPHAAVNYFQIAYHAGLRDRATLFGLANALKLDGANTNAATFFNAARRIDDLGTLIREANSTALDRSPDLPTRIGVAFAAVQRNLEARAWLNLAIRRDPLDQTAQHALFLLDHPN